MLRLINRFQAGSMLARLIAENTLVLQAVVQYARHRRRNDIVLNQAKAYDQVYLSYLHQILLKLGFPTALVRPFVGLFFANRNCININGHLIQTANQGRGLLQGDLVSPFLFNLVLEPLLHHILQGESFLNSSFVPVLLCVPSPTPLKALAYADNVYILLSSRADFSRIQDHLDTYKRLIYQGGDHFP